MCTSSLPPCVYTNRLFSRFLNFSWCSFLKYDAFIPKLPKIKTQSNIDYPSTSGQWPMDRCSDKGNVPDKENVNEYTEYEPHIEGYRKS